MKKFFLSFTALCFFACSAVSAYAWDKYADVFDWSKANQATKIAIVNDLQQILIKNGLLDQKLSATRLVAMVEDELAKDSMQANILEKMCEGLDLNCSDIFAQ